MFNGHTLSESLRFLVLKTMWQVSIVATRRT